MHALSLVPSQENAATEEESLIASEKTTLFTSSVAEVNEAELFPVVLILVPLLILFFLVFQLFFRKVPCGAPTRERAACRKNARGRWGPCQFEAHGRNKLRAAGRALLGQEPRPEQWSGEKQPLGDTFVSSPVHVRAIAVITAPASC